MPRMSLARILLKGQTLLELGGRCPLGCGRRATDLHEVLLERDEANSSPELLQLALESWQNVTGLCNPCNIGPAKTTAVRDRLIALQISRAGRRAVIHDAGDLNPRLLRIEIGAGLLGAWLELLPLKDPQPYLKRLARIAAQLILENDT